MPPRVMIIEDEPAIAELFDDLLTEEGYEVVLYPNTLPELQTVVQMEPALIVVDHFRSFGGAVSGLEFIQTLRAQPATSHIPIIVCTAAQQELRAAEGYLEAQRITIVPKPFTVDAILGSIDEAMRPDL